jgi:ABC-type multidrug transport system fused ATPase/permease subunit
VTIPSIADRSRRWFIGLLVALAMVQAGAAAAGSAALGATIAAPAGALVAAAVPAAVFAILAGLAIIAERMVAERLAQSLVHDVRTTIFEGVIAFGRGTTEERWLTPLVGDLAALRNWAARGIVRLWTSGLAALGGLVWFIAAWRDQLGALIPFGVAILLFPWFATRLNRTISAQRVARGRLTRFLIRRVRAEIGGTVQRGRHGRKCLSSRSLSLTDWARRRSKWAAIMEATMLVAGGLAALLLVIGHRTGAGGAGELVAALALIGFIASRALEFARALHAHCAGSIARDRLHSVFARHNASAISD